MNIKIKEKKYKKMSDEDYSENEFYYPEHKQENNNANFLWKFFNKKTAEQPNVF